MTARRPATHPQVRLGIPGAVAIVGLLSASGAAAEVLSVEVRVPRAFGYFIGDRIPVSIEIEASADDRLDPASLPRPGPLAYWLDLLTVEVDERERGDGRRITVALELQIFYSALEPRALDVPGLDLRVAGPGGPFPARVPGWTLTVSPLREIVPRDGNDGPRLQPDVSPVTRRAGSAQAGLAGSAAVALAALLGFAANRAWWPFHRRPDRPFARAAREIRRLPAGSEGLRRGLLALHRAFDASAGRRLLADDVPAFLARDPRFAGEAAAIAAFFARSRAAFFGGGEAGGGDGGLAALARRLAAAERSGPAPVGRMT